MHWCALPSGRFINLATVAHVAAPTMGLDVNGVPMVIGLVLTADTGTVLFTLSNEDAAACYRELQRLALTTTTPQTHA